MRSLQAVLVEGPPEYPWTYTKLARAIYDTDPPTRSQLSSVARATTRLREFGHLHTESWVDDARGTLVRHEDPVAHVEQLLLALPRNRAYPFRGLASRVYWRSDSWPTEAEIAATTRAVEQLIDLGRAAVLGEEDGAAVPLVVATREGTM